MPIKRLKKVWNYCTYSIPFFIFVLILIFLLNSLSDFSLNIKGGWFKYIESWMIQAIVTVFATGYGLSITRDRINHGYRLPKIIPKEILILGIKGCIVYMVYFTFQFYILNYIASIYEFPLFTLEEFLLDFSDNFHILVYADHKNALTFFSLSGIIFYITTFFGETGLAKLADTKSLSLAFNLNSVYKSISLLGWKNYAMDITSITIAIVILGYLGSLELFNSWINTIWGTFFGFLMYVTQYLGIGAIYSKIKDKSVLLEQME